MASISVHFVNNVLAAAAGYVDDEPDAAREVLADLGVFLSHRLRERSAVPLGDEVDHVRVYLRLEEARFPGRVVAEVASSDSVPALDVAPGSVQAPVAAALARRLAAAPGPVRVALRVRSDASAIEVQLDDPHGGEAAERLRIALQGHAEVSLA